MFLDDKPQGEVKELDAASKLLLKAAELIESQGWCKQYIGTRGGPLCIEGALNVAAGRDPSAIYRYNSVTEVALRRIQNALGVRPFQWNDAPERMVGEVVSKLRAVAFSS